MKKNILKSFFSSGLQAVAVQVLGVVFIAIVAKVLPKEQFGIISWANAVAMFITTALSFGMEQVVVRRIAASDRSGWAAAAFLFHNLVGSVLALAVIIVLSKTVASSDEAMQFLPLFFAAQAILFLVTPLKQFLNAKHMFTPYGVVAVVSNLCKIVLAFVLIGESSLSVANVAYILIACSLIELVALLIYVSAKTSFSFKFRFSAYKKLLKESMPQYMAVIFDSSLSRLDIILLGIIGGGFVATGEYTFAYRAYEMARLPIVIVAPIILNVFAPMLSSGNRLDGAKQSRVNELYTIQMFLAMMIPLLLNLVWSPLFDWMFDEKYGTINSTEFLILSICVPLHFFMNLMWTLSFTAKKYKLIATVTMLTATTNLVLNLVLIPKYGGLGAAVAYLITTVFQACAYYIVVNKHIMTVALSILFKFMAIATIVYISVLFIPVHVALKIIIAPACYILLAFATASVKKQHIVSFKQLLKK